MAGPNRIEYILEGNTLSLEQAIKKVSSLLRASTKRIKELQNGVLNETQKTQVKSLRSLIKVMQAAQEKGSFLSKEQKANLIKVGNEALKAATKLTLEAARVKDRAAKKAQSEEQKRANLMQREAAKAAASQLKLEEENLKLVSIAGQENASRHAASLDTLSRELRGFISEGSRTLIENATSDFRAAQQLFAEGKINQDQLAEATRALQEVYKDYNETLRNTRQEYQASNKAITSANQLILQARTYIEMTLSSMSFWIRIFRQLLQVIKQGIEDFSDYVESINFLNVAAAEATDQLKEFLELQRLALGLDPGELNKMAATFINIATSLGFANEQAAEFSQNLTKMAIDFASLHNLDLETALLAIRSGIAGNTKALRKYGISVDDATMNEYLLSKGFSATMTQLNEATQAYIRYQYILETASNAQGDLNRTLMSPANQLRILRVQLKLFGQNLGAIATNFILPFIKILNQILIPLNAFMVALTSSSADSFTSGVGDATDALEEEAEAAKQVGDNLTSLDEINKQSDSGYKGNVGIDLDILEAFNKEWNNQVESVKKLTQVFQTLGEAMAPIWDMFSNESSFSVITLAVDALGVALTPLYWLLQGIKAIFDLIPKPIRDIVSVFSELIVVILGAAVALTAFKLLALSKVWLTFVGVLKAMWLAFSQVVVSIWANVTATFANIGAYLKQKLAILSLVALLWWETAAWWAKAIAVIAAAGALALVVWGIVAAATASASAKANQAQAGQTATPMAKGGVVTGPTFALIGEGQHNEAVVPLGNSPEFVSMKQNIAAEVVAGLVASGMFGGRDTRGSSQPIILQMDGRELARTLWPKLSATYNQVGVKLV